MRTSRRNTDAILVTAFIGAAVLGACSPFASKGTMPPPGPDGAVNASSAPDFIAVAGRDAGIAGYARKADVLEPGDAPFPVFGDDLRTVVGQMVPGKGFIPAGVNPNTVPNIPVVAAPAGLGPSDGSKVVLYVRNDASTQIHVAVVDGGQIREGGGFWGQNVGIGCFSMPVGSRLVLLDRSATDLGASVLREIYTRGGEHLGPSLWIVISADGTIGEGSGVPDWWGAPEAC
jgi:hypothetical protein